MANKNLFQTIAGKLLPKADAINEAGGIAYLFDPRHALAQYAVTGCLNSTFYASADQQLDKVLALTAAVEPEFIARTALFARQSGYMKDLPALLVAVLSVRSPGLMAEVFDRVIDSPKMLRNFVQIMRSGAVGRKSLGSLPRRMVRQWLEARSDDAIFRGSVGNDPSLADVIKMVHPKPATAARAALYGYLVGRDHDAAALPELVRQFEAYKSATDRRDIETPDVPFQMLTALNLDTSEWKAIARHAPWQATRMNLNTFQRHGVFDDGELVRLIADRLRDAELIRKARAFPYQLMAAYTAAANELPSAITGALQDAMEIAIENVPAIQGKVYVFPDVSGSMQSPVTGRRKGSTTAVRCIDVAALVAAAVVRKNPDAVVMPFANDVVSVKLNPRDSVMTNAMKLASLPPGGTNCSAPLVRLNNQWIGGATGDLVIYVSDNQSWIETARHGVAANAPTATMKQWAIFKRRNPKARMICIDLQPNGSTQAAQSDDVTNVGGFSDQVFELMASVAAGKTADGYWTKQIESVSL